MITIKEKEQAVIDKCNSCENFLFYLYVTAVAFDGDINSVDPDDLLSVLSGNMSAVEYSDALDLLLE